MSIATVVTLGFGSFGSPSDVVTLGFSIGSQPVPPIEPEPRPPLTENRHDRGNFVVQSTATRPGYIWRGRRS